MKKVKQPKVIALCVSLLLVVGVFVGAVTVFGSSEEVVAEEEVSKVVLVDTQSPFIGDVTVTGEYIGTVEPDQQVAVIPKAAGEVLEVYFSVGDTVEAGDVLMELDSTTLRNSLAQTQAAISSAEKLAGLNLEAAQRERENYEENLSGGYNANLAQVELQLRVAEESVRQAEQAMREARIDWREARKDGEDESVVQAYKSATEAAEKQVEIARVQRDSTKALYEATFKNLTDGKAQAADSVAMAEINGDLSQQYLQLQQMQNNLADYTVKAPISGVIEQRNVDPHDMAGQGAAFVISDKDGMVVSFKISEASYPHIQVGDRIVVEKNDQVYTGSVTEISTMVDAGGMFTVKASVAGAPKDLYTGSSVKIYADSQKARNTMLVPLDAVYYDNGTPFVYIADNGVARKTEITAGIYDGQNIEVISGLSLSDRIITTWNANLSDGAEIQLADATGSGAGADETAEAEEAAAQTGVEADEAADQEADTEEDEADDGDDAAAETGEDEQDSLLDEEEGAE